MATVFERVAAENCYFLGTLDLQTQGVATVPQVRVLQLDANLGPVGR